MIKNPNNIDLSRLRYGARQALWYLEHCFALQEESLTVTHTHDGKHIEGSLHFKNRAFDVLPAEHNPEELKKSVLWAMGRDYDLVTHGDHWHCEYDPK